MNVRDQQELNEVLAWAHQLEIAEDVLFASAGISASVLARTKAGEQPLSPASRRQLMLALNSLEVLTQCFKAADVPFDLGNAVALKETLHRFWNAEIKGLVFYRIGREWKKTLEQIREAGEAAE